MRPAKEEMAVNVSRRFMCKSLDEVKALTAFAKTAAHSPASDWRSEVCLSQNHSLHSHLSLV